MKYGRPLPRRLAKKKTGLVDPVPCSVELRCGYITARRELTHLHVSPKIEAHWRLTVLRANLVPIAS
jgi:hypothetical protein